MGVAKKSVSWTSKFVTMVSQENVRRSHITFLVQTFWTHPHRKRYGADQVKVKGCTSKHGADDDDNDDDDNDFLISTTSGAENDDDDVVVV